MATNTLNTRILLRADTTVNWEASTLIMLKGEIGLEYLSSGEIKAKAGNGTDIWNDLPYFTLTPTEINTLITTLNASAHTHSNKSILDSTTASFTTALKTKLDGIAESADNVEFTQTLTGGAKIGTITINGTGIDLYAPAAYTHPNSGVTAGTYKSVTVNAQGHVTGGTNPTTLSGYGITDAASSADLNAEITRATAAEDNLNLTKANLASPTLTGTPKAPTASAGTNTTQIATTAFVQTAISNGIAASDAMVIKGTIGETGTVTELPTTYNTGWTYRVVTAGTYAGNVCEIGDLIIALADRSGTGNVNSDWCVAQTNIDGAITGVKSGDAYLTVSQSGSVITILHGDVSRTNSTSTASPTHGGTFTAVKSVTSDSKGHVTGVNTETVTLPSYSNATTSTSGLMAASDKTKLDGIATGAEVNQNAFSSILVGATTIEADAKMDTLTLAAGSNITITPDATNDKITIAATNTTYSPASSTASGLMSAEDKAKLDGIESGANNYTHPDTSGNKHIPSGGVSGQILRWSADGTAVWGSDNNTTYSPGTGLSLSGTTFNHSNSVTAGTAQGDASKTLNFGGTFTIPTITYDAQGHITAKGTTTMTMPATPTTVSGNAGSATKLATARTIGLGTAVTATAQSFNGTANITIPITAIDAMYLNVNDTDTLILNGGTAS